MTPEIDALRQQFIEQIPGLAIFDELAAKYDRLLVDLTNLERRWKAATTDTVRELMDDKANLMRAMQAIANVPDLPAEVKAITDSILDPP